MIDFTLVLIWRLPHSRFDMIDDPLFDMTSDSPFDMIWLSLRNEGFLTLLLTIEKTVISLSFRTYNLNTPTHHFQRDNSYGKECSFFAKERPFPKRKPDAKNSQNFIISKRQAFFKEKYYWVHLKKIILLKNDWGALRAVQLSDMSAFNPDLCVNETFPIIDL